MNRNVYERVTEIALHFALCYTDLPWTQHNALPFSCALVTALKMQMLPIVLTMAQEWASAPLGEFYHYAQLLKSFYILTFSV